MKVTIKGNEILVSDFDSAQAFRIARHLEKQGIEFYSRLSAIATNKDTKAVLEFLIRDEKRHLETFENELEKITAETGADPESEDVTDLVDPRVFSTLNLDTDISQIINDRDAAVNYAKAAEKLGIVFYKNCLDNTVNINAKEAVKKILEEEKKHLQQLDLIESLLK